MNKSIQIEIANILRTIGSKKCLAKAEDLLSQSPPLVSLHLRDLELNTTQVSSIASCFNEATESSKYIKSISFSNNNIGDAGAIALTKHLPESIRELGLVNCGISDAGGTQILNWMKRSTTLKMVCIEGNHYSERLKEEFLTFGSTNSRILFVY